MMASPVLSHRLIMRPEYEIEGVTVRAQQQASRQGMLQGNGQLLEAFLTEHLTQILNGPLRIGQFTYAILCSDLPSGGGAYQYVAFRVGDNLLRGLGQP